MVEKKPYIIITQEDYDKICHYRDGFRPNIWIKNYISDLREDAFWGLTDEERWILTGLRMLSVLKNNRILYEKKQIISFICHHETNEETLENAIDSLKREGFLAIKMLSERYQNDRIEQTMCHEMC